MNKIYLHHPGRKFYEEYGALWSTPSHKEFGPLRSKFKSEIFLKFLVENNIKPESILDFGCAQGNILAFLGSKVGAKILFGVDISSTMLSVAKKDHPNCRFFLADEKFFYKEEKEKFDVLIFSDVLEHLKNPGLILKKARDKAQYLLINVPLHESIFRLKKNVVPRGYFSDGHLHEFSKSSFSKLLHSSGWIIKDLKITFPPAEVVFHPFTLNEIKKKKGIIPKIKFFIIERFLKKMPYFITGRLLAFKNGFECFVFCEKR